MSLSLTQSHNGGPRLDFSMMVNSAAGLPSCGADYVQHRSVCQALPTDQWNIQKMSLFMAEPEHERCTPVSERWRDFHFLFPCQGCFIVLMCSDIL